MAVTSAQALDVGEALATALSGVEGARVYAYVADLTRVPSGGGVIVIALPTITWNDPEAGFCWGTFDYPLLVATARNQDRSAQQELSRLVRDVANALNHRPVEGIYDIEMVDARPTTATIAGQELPAYNVRVQVRA